MYCPNCGKENPEGRRFCRTCGSSLQAIAPALAGELPTTSAEESSVQPVNRLQAAWQNPLIYALLLILFGIIVGVVGEKALSSQTTHDIGTIIALLGVGLLGVKGVMLIVAPPRPSPPAKRVTPVERTSELKPSCFPPSRQALLRIQPDNSPQASIAGTKSLAIQSQLNRSSMR